MYKLSVFRYEFSVLELFDALYITVIFIVLFWGEKCRLFWSEVENFCRSFGLLKNALCITAMFNKYN